MRIGRSTDMTQGTIWKQLLSFAAPMLLGLIFQQMYNTVDSIVVGNYVSSQALAAVGTTGWAFSTAFPPALRWSSPAPTARGTVSPCTMRCTPPS